MISCVYLKPVRRPMLGTFMDTITNILTNIFNFIREDASTIAIVVVVLALTQLFTGVIDLVFDRRQKRRDQVVIVKDSEGDRALVTVDPTDPESIRRMLQKVRDFEGVSIGGPETGSGRPA